VIRRFCDCCGTELTRDNQEALEYNGTPRPGITLAAKVDAVSVNGTPSADVCRNCLLDAIRTLDTRTEFTWLLPSVEKETP
jgi:hypothetical protein